MNRRGFLAGILATGCAPAVVRASSLMKIVVPERKILQPYRFELITPSLVTMENMYFDPGPVMRVLAEKIDRQALELCQTQYAYPFMGIA